MPLLYCPTCGGLVSDMALACPHCGYPRHAAPPSPLEQLAYAQQAPRRPTRVPTAVKSGGGCLASVGRAVALLLAALLVMGLVLGACVVWLQMTGPTDTPPNPIPYELRDHRPSKTATAGEYRQIQTGMSYYKVREIIGERGEEVSSSDIGGTDTKLYVWKNRDGSNMNAIFQDDKLVAKAQFGLE